MKWRSLSLVWELLARERWATGFVAASLPACYILNLFVSWPAKHLAPFEFIVLLLAAPALFALFTFADGDFATRHAGFPPHLLVLPITNWQLVSIRIFTGVTTSLLYYVAWSKLVFPAWGARLPDSWFGIHLLTFACMMIWGQAIVWALHAFHWLRFLALAATLIPLGWLGIALPAGDFQTASRTTIAGTLLFLIPVGWTVAIVAVSRLRRGEWAGWKGDWPWLLQNLSLSGNRNIRSPGMSQFLFEWRVRAIFQAVLTAMAISPVVITFPVHSALYLPIGHAVIAVVLFSLIMGSTIGQIRGQLWGDVKRIPVFVAVRPVSTGDLVMSKLKAGTLILILAGICTILLSPLMFRLLHWIPHPALELPSWSEFVRQNQEIIRLLVHPVPILLLLAATWQSMTAGLSIGLIGNPRRMMLVNFTGILIFGALISAGIWLYNHARFQPAIFTILPWIAAIMTVAKIVATFVSFRRARQGELLSSTQFRVLAGSWIVVTAIIITGACYFFTASVLPAPVLLFLCSYFLPGNELPNCVLHLAADRHR